MHIIHIYLYMYLLYIYCIYIYVCKESKSTEVEPQLSQNQERFSLEKLRPVSDWPALDLDAGGEPPLGPKRSHKETDLFSMIVTVSTVWHIVVFCSIA